MKYLQKLFASANNQQETSFEVSSATSASKLYTVTFVAKPISTLPSSSLSSEASSQIGDNLVGLRIPDGGSCFAKSKSSHRNSIDLTRVSVSFRSETPEETSAIIVNLNNPTKLENPNQTESDGSERSANFRPELVSSVAGSGFPDSEAEDWIIIEHPCSFSKEEEEEAPIRRNKTQKRHYTKFKMALDKKDIQLIESSWAPAKRDAVSAGILLFKG